MITRLSPQSLPSSWPASVWDTTVSNTTVLQTESATERTMWKLGEEKAREFDTKSRNRSWVMPLGPDAASRGV